MGVTFDFSGTRVLVTGGSNGIGLGVARAFASAGAAVVITGRRGTSSDYEHDLSGFDYRPVEMTNAEEVEALARSLDRLDVLVNNAGASLLAEDEWKPETFEKAVDKGGLEKPGNADLLLGIAYYNGARAARARSSFLRARRHESTRDAANHWLTHLEKEVEARAG